ncbi:MAG: UDP-3-O-(3-hydroxymyristoyl)glucosamine N-acyltransferase [Xanthomonadaceae bacterium]|nr:UDP-3-O-(3-hydroxymyristoyl)glucosamine N-acyltransferase [Xanthomonadaceae bacterium]
MTDQPGYSLGELSRLTGAKLVGDANLRVQRVATLADAAPGSISFLANRRYRRYLSSTRATAVILAPVDLDDCPTAALVTDNPYLVFAKVAQLLAPPEQPQAGIHETAVVHPEARLGEGVSIGPYVVIEAHAQLEDRVAVGAGSYIGSHARIGADSRIAPLVSIGARVVIGARAIIHSGAVIGADGFGFANDRGRWVKVPQLGSVRLGDDVEVGANTCIDRGALGDTIIEDGVKIDNLVQVGHNVRIGAGTAVAGLTAFAGSSTIGRHCMIGGSSAIAGHLTIADNVTITGMTGVSRSIREPGVYSASPLMQPYQEWRKNTVRSGQLDAMYRRLRDLEAELAEMKARLEGQR